MLNDIVSTVCFSLMVLLFFKMEDRFYPPRYGRVVSTTACILVAALHVCMSMTITGGTLKAFVFLLNLFVLTAWFHKELTFEQGFQLTVFIIMWFACLDAVTSFLYAVLNQGVFDVNRLHEMMGIVYSYEIILTLISYKPVYRIIASQMRRTRLGMHRLMITALLLFMYAIYSSLDSYLHLYLYMDNNFYLNTSYMHLTAMFLSVAVYWLFGRLDREYEDLEALQLARQQERMRQERLEKLETDYRASRESAHDMKNHLIAIESLYDSGQRAEAERYLDRLLEQTKMGRAADSSANI